MFLGHVAYILVTIAISEFLLPHWKHADTEVQTLLCDMNTYIIIIATQLFVIIFTLLLQAGNCHSYWINLYSFISLTGSQVFQKQ